MWNLNVHKLVMHNLQWRSWFGHMWLVWPHKWVVAKDRTITLHQICNFLKYLSIDCLLIEIRYYNKNACEGFKYRMQYRNWKHFYVSMWWLTSWQMILLPKKKQLKTSLKIIVKGIQFLNLSNEMLNAC
jgi:hypothetical protein